MKNMLRLFLFSGILILSSFALTSCGADNQKDARLIQDAQVPLGGVQNAALMAAETQFESAQQAVEHMKIGWNVGNSLDCVDAASNDPKEVETYWGNPRITPELIKAVKAAGFSAIRIPVTWSEHMDHNGVINDAWLKRVAAVADMVLAEDMYCIINIHHDTGDGARWLRADAAGYDEMGRRFTAVWQQIALHFISYDEHLLFEGYNEITDKYSAPGYAGAYGGTPEEAMAAYAVANDLNQLFVDTVRTTGGNNRMRNLLCSTYYSSSHDEVLEQFKLPEDVVDGHLIAKVNSYVPAKFSLRQTPQLVDQFDQQDYDTIDYLFNALDQRFTAEGIPFVIAEFGAMNKRNPAERVEFTTYYRQKAEASNAALFWWDNGIAHEFQLFDRNTCEIMHPEIIDALITTSD